MAYKFALKFNEKTVRSARKILERIVMILASNYDEIDFDALYKTQKAKSWPSIGTRRRPASAKA